MSDTFYANIDFKGTGYIYDMTWDKQTLPFTPDIPKVDICPYCKQKKKKKRINQHECD